MAKLSSYAAATVLTSAQFAIVQGGANKLAPITILDERFGQTIVSASDPTNGDDSGDGYYPGTRWINSATLNEFVCISNALGAARWRHVPRVIAYSDTAVTAPADAAVNTLATYSMPANTMGLGGMIEVENYWTITNNANAKTGRVSFGGTNFQSQAMASSVSQTDRTWIRNRTVSSQYGRAGGAGSGGFGATTAALTTAAINTAAAVTVLITAEKASGGDTMTLEGYRIFLTRPDIT